MERKNWTVVGLCLAGFLNAACANGLSSSTGPSGGANTTTSGVAATQTTSSTSPSIISFAPAAGNVTALPTTVQVYFSETTMDPTTTGNISDWSYACATQTVNPLSVSVSNGVATITLPVINNLPSNVTCTLTASSAIIDTSGNQLAGPMSASYTLSSTNITVASGSTQPSVTQFSPPTGTYPTVPGTIQVTFSDYTMTANSVSYIYNWAFVCGSTLYYPTSVGLSQNVATVYVPAAITVLTGGTCTLTVSSALVNAQGNTLSGGAQVVYTLPGTANVTDYNPSANAYSVTGSVGGGGETTFSEHAVSANTLVGLQVRSGTYVDEIQPIWETNYGNPFSETTGAIYGGSGGGAGGLTCTGDASSRVVGIYGRAGAYIDQLGLICAPQDVPGRPAVTTSAAVGGSGGNTFQLICPVGTFVVSVSGSYTSYVSSLQLGCQ